MRTAVVGVGHLGRHHARLLAQEVAGSQLVAVVDADVDRARKVAEPLGVPVLASVQELPDDVRAVSVAVPTTLHHEVACALLERDVHVMVEKPMAATLDEAKAMAALAADRGLVLQVGHIERFNPALAVLRDLDFTPRFIEAHRLAPFNFRTLDVSVVMDLMIHDLDLVLELARSPLSRLEAAGSPFLGKHLDLANARLTFENGCVGNVTASRVSFEPMRRLRLFGEDSFVSLDFGTRRAFVVKLAEGFEPGSLTAADQEHLPPQDSFKEFVQQGLMTLQEIDMDAGNPLARELSAFLDAVRGGQPETGPTGVSAADGLRAMEVAMQVSADIAGRLGQG